MRDKAIAEMAEILFPLAEHVIVTQAENPRSATAQEIREAAARVSVEMEDAPDVPSALERARKLAGRRGSSGDYGFHVCGGRSDAGAENPHLKKYADLEDIGAETEPTQADPGIPRPSAKLPVRAYGWPSRLRSYFILDPLVFVYTFIAGMLSLPFGFFDSTGRILHGFARAWSRLIMGTILCPVKVTGLEKIYWSRPQVIAANHASALDIPILYANLPFQFRIAFKSELLSYPIVGWHLKRSRTGLH